jgi:hypothetical protein
MAETGFNGGGISVGTDVVSSDSAMYGSEVHIVVEQHRKPKIDPFVIDSILGLPVWIWVAQWSPVDVLEAFVFLPELIGRRKGYTESAEGLVM